MARQKKTKDSKLGMRISQLRKLNNMTQNELSELLGVTITSISGYENNHREPDIETLKKLSDIFKVSLDFLIAGESTISDGIIYKLIEKLIFATNNESIQWFNILSSDIKDSYIIKMKKIFMIDFFKTMDQFTANDIEELYIFTTKNEDYFLQKIKHKSLNLSLINLCVIKEAPDEYNPTFPIYNFKIIATNTYLPVAEDSQSSKVKISSNLNDLLDIVKSKEKGESDFIESLFESLVESLGSDKE